MFEQCLPEQSRRCLSLLKAQVPLESWYLAGGTAVALYFGHRISEDFDFFCPRSFSEEALIQSLKTTNEFVLSKKEKNTVWGILAGTKVSFIAYEYPLLAPLGSWNGLTIVSKEDLACMKLEAVASRGTRRDFIDVYWMAQHGLPLQKQIALVKQKYASVSYNLYHLSKSLVYFEDAERGPMPQCLEPVDWAEVKQFFQTEVSRISF